MTEEEQIAEILAKYGNELHKMQTAIAFEMNRTAGDKKFTEPKHLRVGIDSSLVTNKALAELLLEKGIFTRLEYMQALLKATQEEVARWQEIFDRDYGPGRIKLM